MPRAKVPTEIRHRPFHERVLGLEGETNEKLYTVISAIIQICMGDVMGV